MNDMLNMGLQHFTLPGTSLCPEADLNGKAPSSHDFQLSSAKGCPSRRPEGGEERSQSISPSAPSKPGKGLAVDVPYQKPQFQLQLSLYVTWLHLSAGSSNPAPWHFTSNTPWSPNPAHTPIIHPFLISSFSQGFSLFYPNPDRCWW